MESSPTRRGALALLFSLGSVWLGLFVLWVTPTSPYFRPWEILRQGPYAFRPLTELEMSAFGDLGRNAWISSLREVRTVRFSTDEVGLRNPPGARWAQVVVLGDSYVVGSGLDDRETVPAVMSGELGEPVYNHAGVAGLGPVAYLADPRSLETPPRVVLWAPAARTLGAEIPSSGRSVAPVPASPRSPGLLSRWSASLQRERERLADGSLLFATARASFHETYYRVAGKPWEVEQIDVEGQPALVLSLETQGLTVPSLTRRPMETAESIADLKRELERRGSRLVLAPIPETGTVYPEHYPGPVRSKIVHPTFLDDLFHELRRRGVEVVDLRPALEGSRTPYLFLRDDTHLSPHGARVVARTLAEALAGQGTLRAR